MTDFPALAAAAERLAASGFHYTTRKSESMIVCSCGKEFYAYGVARSSGFSLAHDAQRFINLNVGRARRHAEAANRKLGL